MKIRIFLFLWILLTGYVFANSMVGDSTKLIILPDAMNPTSIHIDEDQIYITDGHKILIYGRKDYRLKKILGKPGEEDQAFRPHAQGMRLRIDVDSENIVVNSSQRISIFTKEGSFKSVQDYPYPQTDFVLPINNRYIAEYNYIHVGTGKSSKHILIFDDQLQFVKKITEGPLGSGSAKGFGGPDRHLHVDLIPHFYGFRIFNDKIYIANSYNGFFIEVYDSTGEKLYEIESGFERIEVDDAYRQNRMNKIEDRHQRYIDAIAIDEVDVFPVFQNFAVTDNKIYVYTYQRKENKREIMIMDLEGNYLESVSVPSSDYSKIKNGRYYYLIQNQDEEWELHAFEIG